MLTPEQQAALVAAIDANPTWAAFPVTNGASQVRFEVTP